MELVTRREVSEAVKLAAADSGDHATDRRSLLKKAAVAGSIVWIAPTIMASPANAACGTPKCAPVGTVQLTVTARDACNGESVAGVPTGNKIAIFTVGVTQTVNCPCDAGLPIVVIGTPPTSWAKLVACGLYDAEYAKGVKVSDNQFALYKSGALGNGFYVPNGNFCVSVGCKDRTGNTTYRKCTYTICLDYSPAGSCSMIGNVTVTATPFGPCTTSCDPCS